jgi:hypothetical protein
VHVRKWRTADVWAVARVGTPAIGVTASVLAMSANLDAQSGVT